MTARLAAKVSVGQVSPVLASTIAQAVGDLSAKVAGAIALQVSVGISPPSIVAKIEAASALLASLQAQVGLPEISVSVGLIAEVIVSLQAQLELLIALQKVFLTAGVYVFTHHGAAPTYGPEMQAQINAIAPPGNNVHSVTFLATDPAVFEALGKVLLTG